MSKQLALIRNACLNYDRGIAISFDTFTDESRAALQVLPIDSPGAQALLEAFLPMQISSLNGKPVWVETGDGLMLYSKPAKI